MNASSLHTESYPPTPLPPPSRVSESGPARMPFRPPPRRRIGPVVVVALGVVAVVGALFVLLRPSPVVVTPVVRGTAVRAVYATGTVEAYDRVTVKAKVAGTIVELLVREGARVHKGDVLARISSPALDADLARGRAQLRAAERHAGPGAPRLQTLQAQERSERADLDIARMDRERLQRLVASNSSPQADLDRAASRVASLEAQIAGVMADYRATQIDLEERRSSSSAEVDSLAVHVDDLEVRTPIDGIVLSREIELGQVVSINEPLYRVGDVTNFVLECAVDEADVDQLAVGKKAVATFYAFGTQTFQGTVTEILPDADRAKKTFLARVRLLDPPPGLRSGMSAELNMIIDERPGVLLAPLQAVDSASMVRLVKGSRIVVSTVKLGIRGVSRVEILDGLHEGDHVVVEGGDELGEGARVREKVRPMIVETPSGA
jgi:HlyD family secretion protein